MFSISSPSHPHYDYTYRLTETQSDYTRDRETNSKTETQNEHSQRLITHSQVYTKLDTHPDRETRTQRMRHTLTKRERHRDTNTERDRHIEHTDTDRTNSDRPVTKKPTVKQRHKWIQKVYVNCIQLSLPFQKRTSCFRHMHNFQLFVSPGQPQPNKFDHFCASILSQVPMLQWALFNIFLMK